MVAEFQEKYDKMRENGQIDTKKLIEKHNLKMNEMQNKMKRLQAERSVRVKTADRETDTAELEKLLEKTQRRGARSGKKLRDQDTGDEGEHEDEDQERSRQG